MSEDAGSGPGDRHEADRFHLCVTCGRLKHEELFEEGDCTCRDCYSEGRSGVNWKEAPDGDGFVVTSQTEAHDVE